jgi:CheY-like chemotaxis protein
MKTTESHKIEVENEAPLNTPPELKLIASAAASDITKIKILIVDDSSYNLFVMGELMQQIKFTPEEKKVLHVETALNGQLAVDKVKE